MQNLAGNSLATEIVSNELTRCGINIEELVNDNGEVPSTVWGKLGNFTFKRAWYYYVVEGRVPLSVAKKLYESPVGKQDIRATGHCGCPAPETCCDWYDYMGKRLAAKSEIDEVKKIYNSLEDSHCKSLYSEWLSKVKPIEDVPPDVRKGFIDLYHIDSELGLYIFVERIKQECLV